MYVRGNTSYTGTTTAAGDGYYEVFRGVQVGWISYKTREVVDMQESGLESVRIPANADAAGF